MAAAHGHEVHLQAGDSRRLEGLAWPAFIGSLTCGIGGLLLALIASFFLGFDRLGYAYLVGYAFVLSLAGGCLLFVLLTFLFRAGWVVVVRRPAEIISGAIPILIALLVPILVYVWSDSGIPYIWADHTTHEVHHAEGPADAHAPDAAEPHAETPHADTPDAPHADHAAPAEDLSRFPKEVTSGVESLNLRDMPHAVSHGVQSKGPWLTPWFWTLRWVVYLGIWSALGVYYYRTSTRQDLTGDPALTRRMEVYAAPGTILFALTLTFVSFDLLMSLDPTWFSTMFGVYYFGGTFQATCALMILLLMGMQRLGFMSSVNQEHYHDLGKLMYAFIVFWAYIAFAQYMLIWYGTIPAEQRWMIVRGMSTNADHYTPWNWIALAMLFGRFFIPFFGLMSRHTKRFGPVLAFWCIWILAFHFLDMVWMVMPEFSASQIPLPILSLLCTIGIAGVFAAVAIRLAARHSLVPIGDPRLQESLAFQNV